MARTDIPPEAVAAHWVGLLREGEIAEARRFTHPTYLQDFDSFAESVEGIPENLATGLNPVQGESPDLCAVRIYEGITEVGVVDPERHPPFLAVALRWRPGSGWLVAGAQVV